MASSTAAGPSGCWSRSSEHESDRSGQAAPFARRPGGVATASSLEKGASAARGLLKKVVPMADTQARQEADARTRIVLDTNVLVAAGFSRASASARILRAVREARLRIVWDERTLGETRHIVNRIPPLDWTEIRDLYDPGNRFAGPTDPDAFRVVEDPADRHFAALAHAADATLITNDDHLLCVRDRLDVRIHTPAEFARDHL